MDMSPASQPIVLPDGSSAVDAHAGPTASSSPRRSSSSIATPTDSPSQNIARTPLSPGPGVKTLGDGVSSVGGMGYTASIAPAVTPATFLNSDARLYPRDGRVRDPVPSKLKGVPRDLSANFAVMHMDVNSHPKSKGRDAAAKRTSESTALQARLASTPSYVSHHRRANYPKPPGFKPHVVTSSPRLQGHSISSTLPHAPTPTAPALPAPPAPQVLTTDPDLVMLPLSSHEVKSEQARLLTLLRTLPPSTVVDQICKALAFFGGIPEAPPPADGHFPASGEANGQGSLFVGWVSEIFPNLEQPRQPVPRPPPSPPTLQPIVEATSQLVPQSVKRPRGRPKGSKATKVRSDKGIKKGPLKSARKSTTGADTLLSEGQPDVSAVVDGIPPEVDNMTQGSFSAGSAEGPTTINGTPHPPPLVPLQPSTQLPEVSQTPGKKRGRPKGSKNRPKDNSSVGPLAQPQIQVPPTTTVDRSERELVQQPYQAGPLHAHLPVTETVADERVVDRAGVGAAQLPISDGSADEIQRSVSQHSLSRHWQHLPSEAVTSANAQGPALEGDRGRTTNSSTWSEKRHHSDQRPPTDQPKVKESSIVGLKRKRQNMQGPPDRPAGIETENTGSMDLQVGTQSAQRLLAPLSQSNQGEDNSSRVVAGAASGDHKKKRQRKSKTDSASKTAGTGTRSGSELRGFEIPASFVDHQDSGVDSAVHVGENRKHDEHTPNTQHLMYTGTTPGVPVARNSIAHGQEQHHQPNAPRSFSNSENVASEKMWDTSEILNSRFSDSHPGRQSDQVVPVTLESMTIPPQAHAAILPASVKSTTIALSTLQRPHQRHPRQQLHQKTPSLPQKHQKPSAMNSAERPMNAQSDGPQLCQNSIRQHRVSSGSSASSILNSRITKSPQFRPGSQGSPTLIAGDGGRFEGAHDPVHESASRPQRPLSTISHENHPHRPTNHALQAMNGHSSRYVPRQQSAVGAESPSTLAPSSLQNIAHSFGEFTDSHLFGLHGLEVPDGHHGLGLHTAPYHLELGNDTHLPRGQASSSGPSYSTATDMASYMAHANLGQTNHHNRWHS